MTSLSPCIDARDSPNSMMTTDIHGKDFLRNLDKNDASQTGTIDMGAYEYNHDVDDLDCFYDVYVNSDYDNSHPCWEITYFDNLGDALSASCSPSIVNISNYALTGNVDMTGRAFIIGDQDFDLTGNLSGGLIEVINEGKLSMKGIQSNSSKTFPITDGINNYTLTFNSNISNSDISVKILANAPIGNINFVLLILMWQII